MSRLPRALRRSRQNRRIIVYAAGCGMMQFGVIPKRSSGSKSVRRFAPSASCCHPSRDELLGTQAL